jgi:hypothetical protein
MALVDTRILTLVADLLFLSRRVFYWPIIYAQQLNEVAE